MSSQQNQTFQGFAMFVLVMVSLGTIGYGIAWAEVQWLPASLKGNIFPANSIILGAGAFFMMPFLLSMSGYWRACSYASIVAAAYGVDFEEPAYSDKHPVLTIIGMLGMVVFIIFAAAMMTSAILLHIPLGRT